MTIGHGILFVAYGTATVAGVVLAAVLWRHRESAGAVPLAASLVGGAIFSGARFGATVADSFWLSVLLERLLYAGVGLSVLAILLFALVYTGRERLVRRETVALLSIEPIAVCVLAFANPGNVFFASLEPDPTVPTGVAVEWGVAFGLHTVYSYLLLAVTTALILESLTTSRALYRGQALALLGGTTLPWLANAVHVVGPVTADTTPVGYVLTGALYTVAIVRYRLGAIVPIAHDRVVDTVTEGILVLDRDERLVDANPAGRSVIGAAPTDALVGHPVERLLADAPALREGFDEVTASREPTTLEASHDGSHYEVRSVPIDDDRGRHVGWLVVVYDVTERKRRERELERQNERLERFATVLSHDLRNPLNVASGSLDLARETGDEIHFDRIERSHDRMEAIVEDVLALARTGTPVADPEPASLGDLAEHAWETVDTDDATLAVEDDATVLAEPDRTRRLFENLFRNSVEHGTTASEARPEVVDDGRTSGAFQTGGESDRAASGSASQARPEEVDGDRGVPASGDESVGLVVSVGTISGADGRPVGFYVEDDGPGIPPEDRERIFEDGYTTGERGTGLGLSIVSQIAEAHGWSVAATEGTAGGARFEFSGVQRAADPPPTPN